jgi:hypothetical protein
LEELRKTMKNLSQNSQCISGDSNQVPPEFELRYWLNWLARCMICLCNKCSSLCSLTFRFRLTRSLLVRSEYFGVFCNISTRILPFVSWISTEHLWLWIFSLVSLSRLFHAACYSRDNSRHISKAGFIKSRNYLLPTSGILLMLIYGPAHLMRSTHTGHAHLIIKTFRHAWKMYWLWREHQI